MAQVPLNNLLSVANHGLRSPADAPANGLSPLAMLAARGVKTPAPSPTTMRGLASVLASGAPRRPMGLAATLLGESTPTSGFGLSSALSIPTPLAEAPKWIHVTQRFTQFLRNIELTPNQDIEGHKKRKGVVSCLNAAYWSTTSEADHSFFVGSWGKSTCVC